MPYPRPDRSDYTPARTKAQGDGMLDLAWDEGTLADGRPFRAELWTEDGVMSVTFFFSTLGLDTLDRLDRAQLAEFLERHRLVRFRGEKRFVIAMRWTDAAGQPMWSVGVVVGDEDETYADPLVRARRYPEPAKAPDRHTPDRDF